VNLEKIVGDLKRERDRLDRAIAALSGDPAAPSECRERIIRDFAKWTALSALRAGSPIKSRADVYPLLDRVRFGDVLRGSEPITTAEFDAWQQAAIEALCRRDPRVVVGWAAKLINVYLKAAAYVGGMGRPRLKESLHPPIDRGLWDGLRERFRDNPAILADARCVRCIRDIRDYPTYRRIIKGCRAASAELRCLLIEVEQLWLGAATPGARRGAGPGRARVGRSGPAARALPRRR
jgi:hypothetical protein